MNSDVTVNVPSFILSPVASYSYHNAQTIPPSPASSLPESNPSACPLQPKRRPCLPDQLPTPAQPPLSILPSCRIPAAPQGPGKGFVL